MIKVNSQKRTEFKTAIIRSRFAFICSFLANICSLFTINSTYGGFPYLYVLFIVLGSILWFAGIIHLLFSFSLFFKSKIEIKDTNEEEMDKKEEFINTLYHASPTVKKMIKHFEPMIEIDEKNINNELILSERAIKTELNKRKAMLVLLIILLLISAFTFLLTAPNLLILF